MSNENEGKIDTSVQVTDLAVDEDNELVTENEDVVDEDSDKQPVPAKQKPQVPTKDEESKDDSSEKEPEKESEEEPKPKPRFSLKGNKVPQERFSQVNRKMRIFERTATEQSEHIKTLVHQNNDLIRTLKGLSDPKGATAPRPENTREIIREEMANLRLETRKDQADTWLSQQVELYKTEGIVFPPSFIEEMIDIVKSEGLTKADPLDAYQKAFSMWFEENVTTNEETSSSDELSKRTKSKIKASGVSKAKTVQSKSNPKPDLLKSTYYAYDEEVDFGV